MPGHATAGFTRVSATTYDQGMALGEFSKLLASIRSRREGATIEGVIGQEGSSLMSMHLIVADSDEGVLEGCKHYASLQGMVLRTARGGVECLDELRRSPPDVLVLDLDLPWGGGDGVLSVMQDDESLAGIPVVLLDRNLKIGAGPGRFPANVVGRLIKPLDAATLFESIYSAADCRDILCLPFVPRQPAGPATRSASAYQESARG